MSKKDRYEDMLDIGYPFALLRPRMSFSDRAAQFSPFAALSGHEAAIQESGRLTQERAELNEDHIAALNEALRQLNSRIQDHPLVTITYFQPDLRKEGGAYLEATGRVCRIDRRQGLLWLEDGTLLGMEQLYEIQFP